MRVQVAISRQFCWGEGGKGGLSRVPSANWALNTITERMPESDHLQSMYSQACTIRFSCWLLLAGFLDIFRETFFIVRRIFGKASVRSNNIFIDFDTPN